MKEELSIEKKAEAYDKAIEKFNAILNLDTVKERGTIFTDDVRKILSELAESEDEMIRKAIICGMYALKDQKKTCFASIPIDDVIAWLEKQDEDKKENLNILQRFSFYSYKDEPDILYLAGVFVNKEFRNKGIGTKILEVTDEVAKSLNYHTIRLKTKKDSNAERLYRTHGYNSLTTEDNDEIWLEKQSNKNEIDYDEELKKCKANPLYFFDKYVKVKLKEQKPVDKVEPKFKVGDWVCHTVYKKPLLIVEDLGEGYFMTEPKSIITAKEFREGFYRLWTIQDAKDSDVLACESGWACIFKALDEHINTFSSYCFMDKDKWFCETGSKCHTLNKEFMKAYNGEIKPATKEQRDLLFQKMKEAGYEWDTEKKELKKIEQKPTENKDYSAPLDIEIPFGAKDSELIQETIRIPDGCYAFIEGNEIVIKKGEKPAWSEEDEKMFNSALWHVKNSCSNGGKNSGEFEVYNWLKSLKDRVQPKVELTQLDKNILEAAIAFVELNNHFNCWRGVNKHTVVSALHSLEPQNTWKPSDLQIEALDSATENCAYSEYQDCLRELIWQLKKLREE